MLFKQRVWHGCSLFWVFSTSKIIKQVELAGNFLPEQLEMLVNKKNLNIVNPITPKILSLILPSL